MSKKKVALITRHAISNYGSLLQTIATQKVIEELGYGCDVIDYIREDENYKNVERTLLNSKKAWNNNSLKRICYLALRQPESYIAGKKFAKWRRENLSTTRLYKNSAELIARKPEADIYMTGSDQVWGPVSDGSYDDSYLLSFANDSDKKISYAASFGKTEMNAETIEYYKKWLARYQQLTVREDSAVDILENMGFNAKQVIDPTLLCDSKFWDTYVKDMKLGRYILIYQLHNDNRLGEYAKKVAKEMNLPLIRMSASLHQITREGKFLYLPDIGHFLYLIKNAECMITDSFHGTAFALNFNTDFLEVLPQNKTGSRNISILNLTGLSDRIVTDFSDSSLVNKKIDFSYANKAVEEERRKSIEILKKMLC